MVEIQDYHRRFSSLSRLYGEGSLEKLAQAHVVVAGVGGVGSWAVEALARSGVGQLTLIDLDNVSEGNINRQIHSLSSTVGLPKIEVMRDRILEINDRCEVRLYEDFLTEENVASFDYGDRKNTWIIDAIDQVRVKASLIYWAKRNRYKIITTGAAGGKRDASQLTIDDLNHTYHDPLCARLKNILKREHGYPSKPKRFQVPTVFSVENSHLHPTADRGAGLNCSGYGSFVAVTATMGMLLSSYVINKILEN